MIVLALGLLVFGIMLVLIARWLHRQTHLPSGLLLSSDAGMSPGRLLQSRRYGVYGRPDYLIRRGRHVIPIELKPTQRQAYPSAIMQLAAYCLLVEEHYGRPPHGILVLRDHAQTVPFDDNLRRDLLRTLAAMRAGPAMAPRSHQQAARCRACGLAPLCSDALES